MVCGHPEAPRTTLGMVGRPACHWWPSVSKRPLSGCRALQHPSDVGQAALVTGLERTSAACRHQPKSVALYLTISHSSVVELNTEPLLSCSLFSNPQSQVSAGHVSKKVVEWPLERRDFVALGGHPGGFWKFLVAATRMRNHVHGLTMTNIQLSGTSLIRHSSISQ